MHCRRSEYMVQFRLCGVVGCALCLKIGRAVRTPETTNNSLKDKALSFIPLPIPDPTDTDHYLSPAATAAAIVDRNISFASQQSFLPLLKNGTGEAAKKKLDKKEDTSMGKLRKGTKVRSIIRCVNCDAPRCVFSLHEVAATGGSERNDMMELQRLVEDESYICGDSVAINRLYVQKSHRCYEPVETMYYCPLGTIAQKKKGGRMLTEDVCSMCYTDVALAPDSVIREREKFSVKNPLPVCYPCLALNVKIPGNGIDRTKLVAQRKTRKAQLTEKAVSTGRKRKAV